MIKNFFVAAFSYRQSQNVSWITDFSTKKEQGKGEYAREIEVNALIELKLGESEREENSNEEYALYVRPDNLPDVILDGFRIGMVVLSFGSAVVFVAVWNCCVTWLSSCGKCVMVRNKCDARNPEKLKKRKLKQIKKCEFVQNQVNSKTQFY